MSDILSDLVWREDKISFFGNIYDQPRRVAYNGDSKAIYTYSKIKMIPRPWTDGLLALKNTLEEEFSYSFNSCLSNLYRNGDDYMSYHQDNESSLGKNPIIASLSFGEPRDFLFRHIKSKEIVKVLLDNGDLLIMKDECQHFWQHSLPKRKRVTEPRLNLTFRNLV